LRWKREEKNGSRKITEEVNRKKEEPSDSSLEEDDIPCFCIPSADISQQLHEDPEFPAVLSIAAISYPSLLPGDEVIQKTNFSRYCTEFLNVSCPSWLAGQVNFRIPVSGTTSLR
jgi:hypothetical protein